MISLVPKNRHRSFLYHILRQQYLELIDNGEHERAYSFLMKHLKPLEDISVSQVTYYSFFYFSFIFKYL